MSGRLERLLRIRKACEGIEHGRWDRARLDVAARRADADALAAKRGAVADDVRAHSLGTVQVARLKIAADCRDALSRDLRKREDATRDAERGAEERRRDLEAANRDVRVVEKLSERRAAAERAVARAAENRELDDRPQTPVRP
jgi:flagellar export protein FliJ